MTYWARRVLGALLLGMAAGLLAGFLTLLLGP